MLEAYSLPFSGPSLARIDGRPLVPPRFLLRAVLHEVRERLGLTDPALDVLMRHAEFVSWSAGRRIPDAGGDVVHLLVSGAVRIQSVGGSLDWVTVRIVPPGWLLQQPSGRDRHVSLETHVPSQVAVLKRRALEGLLDRGGMRLRDIECRGWEMLADTLLSKMRRLTLDVQDRLVHELAMLAHDFGREHPAGVLIDLPLAHADLAGLVAATRPSVSRAIALLRKEGRLTSDQHRLVVAGLDGLIGSPGHC